MGEDSNVNFAVCSCQQNGLNGVRTSAMDRKLHISFIHSFILCCSFCQDLCFLIDCFPLSLPSFVSLLYAKAGVSLSEHQYQQCPCLLCPHALLHTPPQHSTPQSATRHALCQPGTTQQVTRTCLYVLECVLALT